MSLQECTTDGTKYPGVADDGTAAVCPECGSDQYNSVLDEVPDEGSDAEHTMSVAEQKEAGVPAEQTVTIADQKAGTPLPEAPATPGTWDEPAGG